MEQYIKKAAVVAEINRVLNSYDPNEITSGRYALVSLRDFLDTLEVKEMQKDSASEDLEEAICQSFIYHENHGDDFRSDKQIETAYRYGFKTGVKYKELASLIIEDIEKQNLEMNDVDLDKKIKDYFDNQPIITRSKGVDYQLIPSGEAIAKHFFELGMKVSNKVQKEDSI